MSTLDQADVDMMKSVKTCAAATRFQYDYLNDDVTDDGRIDFSLTGKVPERLRRAIADGRKILVLINPPYAEASNAGNTGLKDGDENKTGVALTKIGRWMKRADYSYAAPELFAQFVTRISIEIPNATLAMFSTLKYINSPNFEKFRQLWNADYQGGFFVHSKAFDGLKGDFPIGFLIWKMNQSASKNIMQEITAELLNKDAQEIGEKTLYNVPSSKFLSKWIARSKADTMNVPLKNAVSIQNNHAKVTSWVSNGIGYMYCNSNDPQHAPQQTVIYSSVYAGGNGFHITPENLWQIAVVFSVRLLVKHKWSIHNDQFLQPTEPLPEEFKSDCLIWMLFAGKNCTAGADGLEWNGRRWSLVNHFIPFTESEVGASDRFESDFMVQYLSEKRLSLEAEDVLHAGRMLWQRYFSTTDVYSVRNNLKLNRPDVGWYQVRTALAQREEQRDKIETDFAVFDATYSALTSKLSPMVYDLGFLKP